MLIIEVATCPQTPSNLCVDSGCGHIIPTFPSPLRDHFCQQLDNSTSGIKATIAKLMQLLTAYDPQLAAHLQEQKVG